MGDKSDSEGSDVDKTKEIFKKVNSASADDIFMWRESDKRRLRWDILIIVLALYTSVVIPLGIAFDFKALDSVGIAVFDSVVDLIFMIDLLINFRTTYISSQNGDEIYDPKLIAKRYLSGRFIVDLLSSIPFDKLSGNNDYLPMLGMLKLVRVARISVVITNLNIRSGSKALLKVAWLITSLFLYLHVVACLWNYIVRDEEKWVPNKDYLFGGTIYIYEYYAGEDIRKYFICLYNAFYIISSGEMCPRTNTELIISSLLMVGSSIWLANIFGTLAVLAGQMNYHTIKF